MNNNWRKRKEFETTTVEQSNKNNNYSSSVSGTINPFTSATTDQIHKKSKIITDDYHHCQSDQFSKLPSEILHLILCHLTINDSAVRNILHIGRAISLNMLGIPNFENSESNTLCIEYSSQYYRTMTFLVLRNVVESFSNLANKRSIKSNRIDRNGKEQRLGRTSNEEGDYSSSKLFYRLVGGIRELNKLFPYWLTVQTEFSENSIMRSCIRKNVNLNNLYNTMIKIKKGNIPTVWEGDEGIKFYESLDNQFNTILFDSKRFNQSMNKERNWKLLFEKHLEKIHHLEFVQIAKQYSKLIAGRNSRELCLDKLKRIIELLKGMNERTRLFFLFQRNYSFGSLKHCVRFRQKKSTRPHFMSLHQHILFYYAPFVRYEIEGGKEARTVLTNFTQLVLENWRRLYELNNIQASEREVVNDFMLDGPRQKCRNMFLMIRCFDYTPIYQQYPSVFIDYFPRCTGYDFLYHTPSVYHYPRDRFSGKLFIPNSPTTDLF